MDEEIEFLSLSRYQREDNSWCSVRSMKTMKTGGHQAHSTGHVDLIFTSSIVHKKSSNTSKEWRRSYSYKMNTRLMYLNDQMKESCTLLGIHP